MVRAAGHYLNSQKCLISVNYPSSHRVFTWAHFCVQCQAMRLRSGLLLRSGFPNRAGSRSSRKNRSWARKKTCRNSDPRLPFCADWRRLECSPDNHLRDHSIAANGSNTMDAVVVIIFGKCLRGPWPIRRSMALHWRSDQHNRNNQRKMVRGRGQSYRWRNRTEVFQAGYGESARVFRACARSLAPSAGEVLGTTRRNEWRDQAKPQQARELLAPVYGWFTEGFDTLDLKEGKALLDALTA
jgi:hypothetical protein